MFGGHRDLDRALVVLLLLADHDALPVLDLLHFILLDELAELYVLSERERDGLRVGVEAVAGDGRDERRRVGVDLRLRLQAALQVAHELLRVLGGARRLQT